MRIASIPFNEELRLQDLLSYDILNSEQEKEFDDLLEVAAEVYGCPIAAISFVDNERQWFKSKVGLPEEVSGTPREVAFCSHTILSNDLMIVEDATKDERFTDNPDVKGGLSIRFYAGAPIVSVGGFRLGSVCVIDSKPRMLSKEEAKLLHVISKQVSKLLELRLKNKLLRKKAEEQLLLEKLLLQKLLQEHESEKKSISAELHENIAQALAATKFYLEMAEEGGTATTTLIRKSRENILSLIQQVRDLSQTITPSLLKEVELKELLLGMLTRFNNQCGIDVNLIYEGDQSVASSIALTVYRIVEAQLQNVRQHAKANRVIINVNAFAAVYLSVRDNGIGFDRQTFQKGGGLSTILSRVEAAGGRVDITSSVQGGCELVVTIPKESLQQISQLQ
jgi:signal transduction histidine kinase